MSGLFLWVKGQAVSTLLTVLINTIWICLVFLINGNTEKQWTKYNTGLLK